METEYREAAEVDVSAVTKSLDPFGTGRSLQRRSTVFFAVPHTFCPGADIFLRITGPQGKAVEQQGEDRRRHLRFRCGGEAEIRSLSSGVCARGAIANLSLGGCLVQLVENHSFRRTEDVEMTFCVRQLPVRVRASVRQVYPDHHVGVEFTMLSERGKRQLKELIEELAQILRNQIESLAGTEQ
jgi:hypothetical protein